jgi:hypothetical protein
MDLIYFLYHQLFQLFLQRVFDIFVISCLSVPVVSSTKKAHFEIIAVILDLILTKTPDQYFLYDFLSSIFPSCANWISVEVINVSDGASELLYRVATSTETLCEQAISTVVTILQQGNLSETVSMRYVGLLSRVIGHGSESYFSICQKLGAVEIVMSACQQPDLLVQVSASQSQTFPNSLIPLDGCIRISPLTRSNSIRSGVSYLLHTPLLARSVEL